jgi:hypothetical protein
MSEPVPSPLPWARVALPWSTILFGGLAGLGGTVFVLPFMLLSPRDAEVIIILGGVGCFLRGLLVSLAAVLADRVLRRAARPWRWALGMLVLGLVPGLEVLVPSAPSLPHWMGLYNLSGAIRDGWFGLVLGLAAYRQEGAVRRMGLAGALALPLYLPLEYARGGPLTPLLGGLDEAVPLIALLIGAGGLIGAAFGWRLHVATAQFRG